MLLSPKPCKMDQLKATVMNIFANKAILFFKNNQAVWDMLITIIYIYNYVYIYIYIFFRMVVLKIFDDKYILSCFTKEFNFSAMRGSFSSSQTLKISSFIKCTTYSHSIIIRIILYIHVFDFCIFLNFFYSFGKWVFRSFILLYHSLI